MKFILKITITLSLLLISTHSYASHHDAFLEPYSKLLSKYVHPNTKNDIKGTGVNYLAWQSDPLHEKALNLLLNANLSEVDNKEKKMSFWANTYNFLTIDLIIKQGERETIHNLGGLISDPWNEFSWEIDSLEYTLGQIQHQTLRTLGEPRVHFALTCAAVSCPSLKNEPYWPKKIYSQLEERTALFLKNKKKGVSVHPSEESNPHIRPYNTFKASQIFQWFKAEFDQGKIEHFIGRYIPLENAKFDTYIKYDWSLNALKNKEPEERARSKKEPDVDSLYQ